MTEMVPRKKRQRYKTEALQIANELGISIAPNDWDAIWGLLDRHRRKPKQKVYAIIDLSRRVVKFGKSCSPMKRLYQIKTGNAGKIYLIGYCEQDEHINELSIHKRLSHIRYSGEWFHLNAESQTVIDEIKRRATKARSETQWVT